MSAIIVGIDLSRLTQEVGARIEQAVDQAIHQLAIRCGKEWAMAIDAAGLPDGTKYDYLKSLHIERVDWASYLIRADYPKAQEIEHGRTARDLKCMLDTSTKVRRTHDGRRFLVIPLRWNTPGNVAHARAMPAHIYARAVDLEFTRVTGTGTRPSGEITERSPQGGMRPARRQSLYLTNPATRDAVTVARQAYAWGGRLSGANLTPAERRLYGGMVRTHDSATGRAAGYLTFRTMMEGSPGWIIPAKPGLHIARDVAAHLEQEAGPFVQGILDELLK